MRTRRSVGSHLVLVRRFVRNDDRQRRGAAVRTSGSLGESGARTQLGAALSPRRFNGNAALVDRRLEIRGYYRVREAQERDRILADVRRLR